MDWRPPEMSHSHHHVEEATGDLRLAFFLNLGSALLELFGGLWTNSVAILSDAVHDLGDSLSLGVAWYLDRYARRSGDAQFSYGYRRFTLLGAWTNTVVLLVGSVFVLSEAIPRLFAPEPAYAPGMLLFAAVGIGANGLAAWRLRGKRSLNARVAAWHLVEDILGWIAVLVVATTLLFVDLPILDPLLSIGISIYILYNVGRNLRQTLRLFLQAVPEDVDLAELERRFGSLHDVLSAHHTHVWSMDGAQHVLTTHLIVAEGTTKDAVCAVRDAASRLCEEHDFAHTTIEIEWGEDACHMAERSGS